MPFPPLFEQRERALLGARFEELFCAPSAGPVRGATVNLLRCTPDRFAAAAGFAMEPSPFCPSAFVVKEPDWKPGRHPYHHAGVFYAQEPSAAAPAALLDVRPGMRVADLCAAPGGKTSQLAAALQGQGILLANEYVAARAEVLRQNLERMGVTNAVVTNEDTARLADALPGFFDRILVDAPCSGEGMFRKDPRARKEWSEDVVKLCAARQKRILSDVWPSLKSGGVMVYSTCTYERCENDEILLWASESLGAEILAPQDEFPQSGVALTECGSLLRAGEVPGEGQWVGAMRKTGEDSRGRKAAGLQTLSPRRFPLESKPTDPDWALSIKYSHEYPEVELDKKTALRYLHRDSLQLPDAPLGYLAVTYRGVPLGFVKNLGRRCNNLLPMSRRILMDVE